MLIIRRKKSESFLIGDDIRVTILECAADGVRVAIDAPKHVSILREELSEAEQLNRGSLAPQGPVEEKDGATENCPPLL